MDEATILRVLNEPPWSDRKLKEAARGEPIGSCNDPPDVLFAFWLNLARDQASRYGLTIAQAEQEVVDQAMRGDFG
jgi:hypothetical protein